jgi:hypothetical protein
MMREIVTLDQRRVNGRRADYRHSLDATAGLVYYRRDHPCEVHCHEVPPTRKRRGTRLCHRAGHQPFRHRRRPTGNGEQYYRRLRRLNQFYRYRRCLRSRWIGGEAGGRAHGALGPLCRGDQVFVPDGQRPERQGRTPLPHDVRHRRQLGPAANRSRRFVLLWSFNPTSTCSNARPSAR